MLLPTRVQPPPRPISPALLALCRWLPLAVAPPRAPPPPPSPHCPTQSAHCDAHLQARTRQRRCFSAPTCDMHQTCSAASCGLAAARGAEGCVQVQWKACVEFPIFRKMDVGCAQVLERSWEAYGRKAHQNRTGKTACFVVAEHLCCSAAAVRLNAHQTGSQRGRTWGSPWANALALPRRIRWCSGLCCE